MCVSIQDERASYSMQTGIYVHQGVGGKYLSPVDKNKPGKHTSPENHRYNLNTLPRELPLDPWNSVP